MDLQQWFYILGIIFMVISLLLIISILSAVLVIKKKIDHMHKMVNDKLDKVRDIKDKGTVIFRTVKHFMGR